MTNIHFSPNTQIVPDLLRDLEQSLAGVETPDQVRGAPEFSGGAKQ